MSTDDKPEWFEDRAAREFWDDLRAEFGAENVQRGIHDEVIVTPSKTYFKDGWLDRLIEKLKIKRVQ